jgi:hypothetical protein
MRTSELIKEFADRTTLPIDVNDVLACLREHKHDDEVEFIGVTIDADVLLGAIKVFYASNGVYDPDPTRMVNIYYRREETTAWQRMICCKELVHLLDPPDAHTNAPEDIERLAEKIGLPPEMQDPTSDGFAANVDRLAEFRATALLFPLAARNLLMAPYKAGTIRLAEIAALADIPSRYVGFAMSDYWDEVHGILVS